MRNLLLLFVALAIMTVPTLSHAQSDSIRFSAGITLTGAANSLTLASSDFDGNGWPDLVAGHLTNGYFSLFSDTGHGHFASPVQITCDGGKIYYLTAADLDSNGSMDLAVSCFSDIWIFKNDGSGTLTETAYYPIGTDSSPCAAPYRTIAVDVNKDGKPDLVSAAYNNASVSILLNKGDAEFDTAYVYHVGVNPSSVCAADFDKDGNIDLAAPCTNSNAVYLLKGNGDGTFGTATSFVTGSAPNVIAAGDLNGDTWPDLVVARFSVGLPGSVGVYLNDGDGNFTLAHTYGVDVQPRSMVVEDFDGDHNLDLAVGCLDNGILCVFKGKGDGSFGQVAKYPSGGGTVGICAADFDNDGYADLAASSWFGDVTVFMNESRLPAGIDNPADQRPLPLQFELNQNFPNPFNPGSTITYSLPVRSHALIEIYNVLGQPVRQLVDQTKSAGTYSVVWDGTDDFGRAAATGIYFYRLQAGNFVETRKMVLLK